MGSTSFNKTIISCGTKYDLLLPFFCFMNIIKGSVTSFLRFYLLKWWQQRCSHSEELTESRWWHLGDKRDQMSRPSAESSFPTNARYLILVLAHYCSNNNRGFCFLFWSIYCSHGFSRLSSFKSGNSFLFYNENIPPFKGIYKGREGLWGRTKRRSWVQESVQEKRNRIKEHNRVYSSNFLCCLLSFFTQNNLGGLKIVTHSRWKQKSKHLPLSMLNKHFFVIPVVQNEDTSV